MTVILPRVQQTVQPDDPLAMEAQRLTGVTHKVRGRIDEAEESLQQLRRRAGALGAGNAEFMLILESLLSALVAKTGREDIEERRRVRAEIISVARELIGRSNQEHGLPSVSIIWAQSMLAQTLWETGGQDNVVEAAQLARSVVDQARSRLGECHVATVTALRVLAWAMNRLGEPAQAADMTLKFVECRRARFSGDPVALLSEFHDAMPYLEHGGRWAEGEAIAREYLAHAGSFGDGHGGMAYYGECFLARFLCLQGRLDEAEPIFQSLRDRMSEIRDAPNNQLVCNTFLAGQLMRRGDFEEAEKCLRAAERIMNDTGRGGTFANPYAVFDEYIALYQAWEKPDLVAKHVQRKREAMTSDAAAQPDQ
jgi:hypothetical protein